MSYYRNDDSYYGDSGDYIGRSAQMSPQDEKTWAILAHISAPVAAVLSVGTLSILGPLLIWLFTKDRSAFVRRSAAASVNFNIILWITWVVGWIMIKLIILFPIGLPLVILAGLGTFVVHVLAAVSANEGKRYRYPVQLPILH